MFTNFLKRSGVVLFAAALALAGCQGDKGPAGANGVSGTDGTDGTNGTNGTNGVPGKLSLTIDGVVTAAVNGTNTATVTFTVRPAAAVCPGSVCDDTLAILGQKTFYASTYDPATKTFTTAKTFSFDTRNTIHFKGFTADGNGAQYTATKANPSFTVESSTSAFVYGYITSKDPVVAKGHYYLPSNVASASKVYGTIDYASNANVAGCEKCHNKPYSKHGYRQATVAGLADFVACKACHTDQRAGSDGGWYMVADDPANYAKGYDADGEFTVEPYFSKYAYTANIMNDVHNSHAFEFAYPQSMSNCVTCHEGKLDAILTDANFTPQVCKSCHPVTGPYPGKQAAGVEGGRAPSLLAIFAERGLTQTHAFIDLYKATAADTCNMCHKAGSSIRTFKQIHAGFNKSIYSAEKVRYADSIKVTVGETAYDAATHTLTVPFSIAGTAEGALVNPTVSVSLYGWDSKDFVVSGHGSQPKAPDGDGLRNLEFAYGASNSARLTLAPAEATPGNTEFTATADLSTWAALIDANTVRRVQVSILPTIGLDQTKAANGAKYLPDPGKNDAFVGFNTAYNPGLAVTGASVTINLSDGKVDPKGYGLAIVDSAKCNACHEALGTTFHNPNYGSAGVVACRNCHWVGSAGSHLEMQSRSIDSYVHAIHSMQYFDPGDVNFADTIEKLRYDDHVESSYPNFAGTLNCDSCHNPGTYEVPDQTKSLPGVLSGSDTITGWTRNIGTVAAEVVGPAARACGGCHRAQSINEDDASSLAAFYQHTAMFGTSVEGTTQFDAVTADLMGRLGVGPTATEITGANVETCAVCHPGAGSKHQALFNTWLKGL